MTVPLTAVPAAADESEWTVRDQLIVDLRERGVQQAMAAIRSGRPRFAQYLLTRSFIQQTRIDGCGHDLYGQGA